MISPDDFQALWLTFELATLSTVILLLLGTPLAWWLAFTQSRMRFLVDAFVALPLVLPPTVLGFYLLILLGPTMLGSLLAPWDIHTLAFSFSGLVIGSVVYSLPFVVQPLKNAFISMGRGPLENAALLGAGRWDRFFQVALPSTAYGYLTAATLAFAHTLGEFGVVLMIGGNIPGQTQVVSIAIYNHVESLEYSNAHTLSFILLALSFVILLLLNFRFRFSKEAIKGVLE